MMMMMIILQPDQARKRAECSMRCDDSDYETAHIRILEQSMCAFLQNWRLQREKDAFEVRLHGVSLVKLDKNL